MPTLLQFLLRGPPDSFHLDRSDLRGICIIGKLNTTALFGTGRPGSWGLAPLILKRCRETKHESGLRCPFKTSRSGELRNELCYQSIHALDNVLTFALPPAHRMRPESEHERTSSKGALSRNHGGRSQCYVKHCTGHRTSL